MAALVADHDQVDDDEDDDHSTIRVGDQTISTIEPKPIRRRRSCDHEPTTEPD